MELKDGDRVEIVKEINNVLIEGLTGVYNIHPMFPSSGVIIIDKDQSPKVLNKLIKNYGLDIVEKQILNEDFTFINVRVKEGYFRKLLKTIYPDE